MGFSPRLRGRPDGKTFEVHSGEKQQVVLSVIRGELSVAEAGRRFAASETSISKWRDLFVEGGVAALKNGSRAAPSGREAQLEHELADLTHALGEAHVELRILRRGGVAGFATRSWR
jgi:transposase